MTNQVLFERRGRLGIATLNRPQALNALSHEMVLALDSELAEWEDDDEVAAVLIRGAGDRAFCAGGDIRAFYDKRDDPAAVATLSKVFYRDEYRLNRRIFRYPKPYIALVDGITMGGGVGVSVHGTHWIATERTMFAMPETGIGFFPDVGGGYFLPRLPGLLGMYLALTGARLKATDCLYAGIASHVIASAQVDELVAALAKDSERQQIDSTLAEFAGSPEPAPLAAHRETIDRCFAAASPAEMLTALDAESSDWAAETAKTLRGVSPTSVAVTFRQIHAGAGMSFEDVMKMEYRLSQRFNAGHDYFEGIRAAIVDKDRSPRWQPDRLDGVSGALVEDYFAAVPTELTFN